MLIRLIYDTEPPPEALIERLHTLLMEDFASCVHDTSTQKFAAAFVDGFLEETPHVAICDHRNNPEILMRKELTVTLVFDEQILQRGVTDADVYRIARQGIEML